MEHHERLARPRASISLDLDNEWAYLKVMGDDRWKTHPSYLPEFIPSMLDFLDRLGLRITFFLVGADCEKGKDRDAISQIIRAGHEVANHSHEHEPWLCRSGEAALENDIATAEEAIRSISGRKPSGYRAPGYACCDTLLRILAKRGYDYDASILPTWISPLARAWFYRHTSLSPEERRTRSSLFGTWRDSLLPAGAYRWGLASSPSLLEIPVSTMPILRLPMHMTSLSFFSTYSKRGTQAYFRAALRLCAWRRITPSFLLHPLDLWGGDRIPRLRRLAGMSLSSQEKTLQLQRILSILGEHFETGPMCVHARALNSREDLPLRVSSTASVPVVQH